MIFYISSRFRGRSPWFLEWDILFNNLFIIIATLYAASICNCIIFLAIDSLAQDNPAPSVYNVIPPSPNAAAMAKYGDLPVSLYTGTASIDIPIYTVVAGDLKLPIAVNYHSGGIKVEEKASNVGLGWSLSAGGVIARTVRGIPDELPNGYLNNQVDIENVANSNENTQKDLYIKVNKNQIDLQPDVFTFNFFGKSGKFLIDRATRKGYLINANEKIDIEWISNGTWKITDASGFKYYFGGYNTAVAKDVMIVSQNGRIIPTTVHCPSAWYLLAAEDIKGNYIYFSYTNYSTSYCNATQETRYTIRSSNGDCDIPNVQRGWDETEIEGSKISTITWKNGKVDFVYSTASRTDLESNDGMLDAIIVSTSNTPAQTITRYDFLHSYFDFSSSNVQPGCTGDGTTGRLRLDKIQQQSTTAQLLSPYEFYYDGAMPSYGSMSQDHWGYFNGKNNATMVPETRFAASNGEIILEGGNRNPVLSSAQQAALKKVVYPTGGSTEFFYELHDVNMQPFAFEIPEVPMIKYAEVKKSNMVHFPEDKDQFTVNGKTWVNGHVGSYVTVSVKVAQTCNPSVNGSAGCGAQVYIQYVEGTMGSAWVFGNLGNVTGTVTERVFLINGTYELIMEGFHNISEIKYSEATVFGPDPSFFDSDGNYNKLIGGLRIKKQISKDGSGNSLVTNYRYRKETDNTRSSGILVSHPSYSYTTTKTGPNISCEFYARTANSKAPLGTTQGSHIGYEFVEVIKGDDLLHPSVGKTTYKYTTAANFADLQFPAFPFPPATSSDMRRGLLLESKDYKFENEQLVIVKQTINAYKIPDFRGRKYSPGVVVGCRELTHTGDPLLIIFKEFRDESQWVWLSEQKERNYSADNPNIYLETTTKYSYDNPDHKQVTKIEKTTSKNESIVAILKYPADYNNITATDDLSKGIKELQVKSVNDAVIEKSIYKSENGTNNTRLVSSIFNSYKQSLPLIDKIYLFEESAPVSNFAPSSVTSGTVQMDARYKAKVLFSQYDVHGNILEQQKADDVKQSYKWGYDEQYPIAEVINAPVKDIFYTSFEDAEGNSTVGNSKTGNYSRTGGYIKMLTGLTNGSYTLTYWKKAANSWNFQTVPVAVNNNSYEINISGQVDEVRFHPKTAQMTTYTYNPLIGITSQSDVRNRISYYEYDDFQRLKLIRDHDGNILKTFEYKYRQQQ